MSGWYTTRETSTWFEASDAQAWVPSSQNSSSFPASDLKTFKTQKLPMVGHTSKEEVKLDNHQYHLPASAAATATAAGIMAPPQKDMYYELPSNISIADQNAWNAYVIENSSDDYLNNNWDTSSPTSEIQVKANQPEKVLFSKLKRNVDIEEELTKQNLYKTEFCQSWMATGDCRYGAKCQYAHGKEELRFVIRHPKYKTENCKTFSTTGQCPYGKRCRFVHQLMELRPSDSSLDEAAELDQIQQKLQEFNLGLAPDPVFPSPGRSVPTTRTHQPNTAAVIATTNITSTNGVVKKGSRLPFLQKLRKQL